MTGWIEGMLSHPRPTVSMRACRATDDLLVGGSLLPFDLRIEVVGFGFEEDAEDVSVALFEVAEDAGQGVVTQFETPVLVAEQVGGVLHLVLERGVEEDREPDVVEHGGSEPYEEVYGCADDALFAAFASAEAFEILFSGHVVNTFRSWFRAGFPSAVRTLRPTCRG